MRKLALAAAAAALVGLFAGSAMAQSAKFDATWDNNVKFVEAVAVFGTGPTCTETPGEANGTDCILAEATIATLKVPQQKDLLIGVSAQIGLVTFTQAKGKGGTTPVLGEALAEAAVTVTLELREAVAANPGSGALVQTAAPGPVIFASRLQELKVADTDMDTTQLTTVTVSLLLETTAAHHFNFLGVDLDSGDYDVVAVFNLSAFASVVTADDLANAKVILGPRMVTVQEVRAVQGSLEEYTAGLTQCADGFDNDGDGDVDLDDADCADAADDDESS